MMEELVGPEEARRLGVHRCGWRDTRQWLCLVTSVFDTMDSSTSLLPKARK